MVIKHSVLVVGAGPAGCSAALFLKHFDKEDKLNVELIDRLTPAQYTSYHEMCGECVGNEILRDMLPIRVKGITGKIKFVRELYPSNIEITMKIAGLLVDRPILCKSITDEFTKLGGRFTENCLVQDFSKKR